MKKSFNSALLYSVRNDIPMVFLISKVLQIQKKSIEGIFRFLCPLCNEFHTAVNPKTNLARCFRCNQNWNPIDLVMAIRNWPFKKTVAFLQQFLPKNPIPCPQKLYDIHAFQSVPQILKQIFKTEYVQPKPF